MFFPPSLLPSSLGPLTLHSETQLRMSPVSSPKYSSGSTLLTQYGPFDQTLSYNRTQVLSSSRYGASTSRYLGSSPCQARAHNYPREMERGRADLQLDLRVRHGDTSIRPQVRGQGHQPNVVRGRSTSRSVHSPVSPLSMRRRSVSYSDLAQELVLLDINGPPSPPPRQHRVGRVGAMRNGILIRNSEVSYHKQFFINVLTKFNLYTKGFIYFIQLGNPEKSE